MLDTTTLLEQTYERLNVFFFTGLLGVLAGWIAWQKGFFQWSKWPPPFVAVKGTDVIKGFLAFLLAQVVIVPAIIVIIFKFFYGIEAESITLHQMMSRGWISLLSILGGFISVYFVFFTLPASRRRAIWGSSSHWLHDLLLGAATWFISFPIVTAIGQLISIAVLWIFQQEQVDQVAVKHVKDVTSDPLILALTVIGVTMVVPCVEELLFRGLLQSWLRAKLKRSFWAIALTSLIFALFHYSTSQGITNIELIFSLFVLSCFLGFLYERQRSLWASIGLHGFFNAISIVMIINQ